jgi:hypothetical protein
MPLEFVAEVLLRFVFEIVFYVLGYATGWLLIPVFSFGRYTAEPLSPPRRGQRRGRSRAPKGPRQVSIEFTALIGILFWIAVPTAWYLLG